MPVPKSVTKIKKGNLEFVSNVDQVNYTINELTRAALRDVGKFVCNRFRASYYGHFKKKKGNVGKYTQYWVRKKEMDLQVGLKPNAFYGGFQEVGSSKQAKLGLLEQAVNENINKIIEIESQYLSALNNSIEAATSMCDEKEYEGGAE